MLREMLIRFRRNLFPLFLPASSYLLSFIVASRRNETIDPTTVQDNGLTHLRAIENGF
jgi:hypothetical protein